MSLDQIPLLLIFLLPLAYSPGPGNMYFAAFGARYGLAASWPAMLGYHLATLVVSFAIGTGFMVVLEPDSRGFAWVQGFGALYILWLAWRLHCSHGGATLGASRPAGAVDGAILLLMNPKGYLIMALMFSQFPGMALGATAVIAGVFTLNNMIAFVVWTAAGQTLSRLFATPRAARLLNDGFAICLAGVAIWLLIA